MSHKPKGIVSVLDKSGAYSITIADIQDYDIINVTTGAANKVMTLPVGTDAILYKTFQVIKKDSAVGFVEIARSGADTIRGSATSIYAIQKNEAIELINKYKITDNQ